MISKEDIQVNTNGSPHSLQIKSGQIQKSYLTLSGNRLGRFNGDFRKITQFLNNKKDNIISIPCAIVDDEKGRSHIYKLIYIDIKMITGIARNKWEKKGAQYIQQNSKGVIFSLRPQMSWQIWWKIPLSLLQVKLLSV